MGRLAGRPTLVVGRDAQTVQRQRINPHVGPRGAAFPMRAERRASAIRVLGDGGDDVGDFIGREATAEIDGRQVMAVHAIGQAAEKRLPQIRSDPVDDELIRGDTNGKPWTVFNQAFCPPRQTFESGQQGRMPGGIHRAPMERDGHVHEELRQLTRRLRSDQSRRPEGPASWPAHARRSQAGRRGTARGSHIHPDHRRERHGASPVLHTTAQVVLQGVARRHHLAFEGNPPMRSIRLVALGVAAACLVLVQARAEQGRLGYYRFPAIWHDTIVFTAEGNLWRVPVAGGVAQRLTTHPSLEAHPAVWPDGSLVAFDAAYEGPREVYTVSLQGGLAERQTWDGTGATVVGWTPDGSILYSTDRFSGIPNDR